MVPSNGEAGRGRRATLRDVAALAGVDASLVSRVINDDPKASASAETRQRIETAAAELNYLPNAVARGLRMSRTSTLGLLLPNVTNPMYADIIAGADATAQQAGYNIVFRTHVEDGGEDTFTKLLQQGRVDGLMIASGVLTDAFMRRIASDDYGPVVLVNRRVQGIKASVVVDDEAGALMATRHLLDKGHHSIGGIFGPHRIDTSRRRRRGYELALRKAGASPAPVHMSGWSFSHGYEGVQQLLEAHADLSAVFASTNVMAIGALRALHDLGRSVPEDISVVSLHDNELVNYTIPPLTTVRLPVKQMGSVAVEHLISLINGGDAKALVVDDGLELVERSSVAQR